jgi:hypothetical protein
MDKDKDAIARQLIADEHEIKYAFYQNGEHPEIQLAALEAAALHNEKVKALGFDEKYLIDLPGMPKSEK